MTQYFVFKVVSGGKSGEEGDLTLAAVGSVAVEAHSDIAAVRAASKGKPGTYVAVPARSFRQRTVSTKTIEQLSIV